MAMDDDAEEEEEEEEEGVDDNALYSQFTGSSVSDPGGGGGESMEDQLIEEDPDAEMDRFLRKLGLKKKQKSSSAAKNSIPFGKDRIAKAGQNIFSIMHQRYQIFRSQGEFIEGPPPRNRRHRRHRKRSRSVGR